MDIHFFKTGCLVLVLALSLCSCGVKDSPPEDYMVGTAVLPAVPTEEDVSFSMETDAETQQSSYLYENLTSVGDLLSDYVEILEEDYDCQVINNDGIVQPLPDFQQDGSVLLATDNTDDEGAVLLQIQWTESSLTVTPTVDPDLQIKKASSTKTLDELIQIFEHTAPEKLGLSGSMEDYGIYPEEGYIFIDDLPFIRLNIYEVSTHRFEKTFVISSDGETAYELDRDTKQLTPVKL